jgi:hypothetical protein
MRVSNSIRHEKLQVSSLSDGDHVAQSVLSVGNVAYLGDSRSHRPWFNFCDQWNIGAKVAELRYGGGLMLSSCLALMRQLV